ncbi:hypothetical protein PVMG_05981 [Plasmodium vivax Mauritania I]|uniref:VIR protein n=1 Tax=Plasmodium vivax Mauritania I TaxID=1035515 RepID=A0A0J9TIQ7_PLAVI|nr:hypothetical protein PVMG_05981 [Plasmodium vivax Mauritania I]
MYDKMEKLYALYEKYDDHKRKYNVLSEEKNCPSLLSFLNLYNDFLRHYQPTNEHYKNILVHFDEKIKKRADDYKFYACNHTQFYRKEIKLHTLPKEEQPKSLDEVQHKPNNTEYLVSPENSLSPEVKHQAPRENPRKSQVELQTSHALSQTHHTDFQTLHTVSQRAHEESQTSEEPLAHNPQHAEQEQGIQHVPIPNREFPIYSSPGHIPHYESLESSGTTSYSDRNPYSYVPPSSNELGDTSSSVMNTITSALRDVEPGYVLGVSGGMGVLFLLFKYTPVGFFFGGRRGRIRQIPSSFRGFPPADFANFQEYDGGLIGYGPMNPLAE